ncbi:hypothetical protein EJB05_03689 [Eragrostis curvula]|uniref:HTH La-type RNA-binding domain-containing protein n=1 Tax=Eragrostis curvula TaxID=38414 RepID=A0A5J9W8E7_9POAL|nr:hypothetical protein EJB05_03689 [Eragrostis curvula]
MEPPAAAVSPDPTPQEHSPAPSPAKRSPWKPTAPNGVVEPGVMDANHWPALSETAKATTKPAPAPDSSRPPDSAPAPVASSAVANSSNSQKHSHHGRHKPARRGGASGGDHSPRDHPDRNTGGWDHGGGGRGGQRNHNNGGGRRGNGSGGGGVSHHGGGGGGGFGGRRRGGYDGFYRGPPPMGMGPYMRGAPPPPPPMAVPPPFMGPPPPPVSPMRAFAGPMVFHEMPSPVSPVSPMYYFGPPPPPEALRGMALAPPMGPPAYPYFQAPHELQPEPEADAEENQAKLLKQIEFYFSKDNLCTDVFLRRKMDDQGWVDISLIAGFKKVRELTNDVQYIKETIQSSSILEIQDDKIRRQNDWDKWVIPRESNPDVQSSSASLTSRTDVTDLTAHLGGVNLHESTSMEDPHEVLQNGSSSSNDQGPVVEDNSGNQ